MCVFLAVCTTAYGIMTNEEDAQQQQAVVVMPRWIIQQAYE